MASNELDLGPQDHSGLRVERVKNGYLVYVTADTNYVRGDTFVAANLVELARLIRKVQIAQARAMIQHFTGMDVPDYAGIQNAP